MGYLLNEIIEKIEEKYPRSLALEWDNPGLICGHHDKRIDAVMLALDADRRVIERAVKEGADLILTHHPMIFGSLKQVNDENALGRKLLYLIENGIACYAMHTNFDIAKDGMGDGVAKRLNIKALEPLEATNISENEPIGIGFVGETDKPEGISAKELSENVKKCFGLDAAWYYDAKRPIRRIAVCPGSGKGMMKEVVAVKADAFITGDTGHHDGLDYIDEGISLIDAGHFGLEHIFTDIMAEFFMKNLPEVKLIKEVADERKFI